MATAGDPGTPPLPPPPPPPSKTGQIYGTAVAQFRKRQFERKKKGYKILSKWIASDRSFFAVRRFGALNARVALSMQDEIVRLEDELEHMDKTYSELPGPVDNGSFRDDPFGDRKKMVEETLPKKLLKYNNFINSYSQILCRPEIHHEDLSNLQAWLCDPDHHGCAINPLETEFIMNCGDLIPLHPKKRSWFRNVLESTLVLKMPYVRKWFERRPSGYEELQGDKNESKTIWQDDDRVEGLSAVVISFIGLGMLVGPLWALAYITSTQNRLACITGFIVVFFILVGVATTARVFEVLAAAAAYSAVLTVFLQVNPI